MKDVIMNDNNVAKKKSKLLAIICVSVAVLVLVFLLVFFLVKIVKDSKSDVPSVNRLYSLWQKEDYRQVYDTSALIVEKNPLNIKAVLFHGYSSFFLALSQTDVTATHAFLDEAINYMRFALIYADRETLPQLYYMLGKAYFQKNIFSSYHYYSDLVIKYLELAKDRGYVSPDISEFLGLCYSDLGMIDESLTSFTQALMTRESDSLLLAIARQYYKKDQKEISKQYLARVVENSTDDDLVLRSKLLLADILFDDGQYSLAEKEYESVILKDNTIADAYYGLGNIYEKYGDTAKARSEWRKALKVQVNHAGAIKKLGI